MGLSASLAPITALTAEGGSHFPPTVQGFWQPLFHMGGDVWLTRPMVQMAIVTLVLCLFLLAATRRLSIVPSKGQWMTEQLYDFVRNGVARDMIGSRNFRPFVPFLFSLFTMILLNNWLGIIPFFQYPTMSRIGFPIALTLLVYVVYHWIGLRRHGLGGYFKFMVPSGLPGYMVPVIFILELATFFVIRPLTLALRLFGNMFAGHMLLLVFIIGGWELLTSGSPGLIAAGVPAWIMAFAMTVFEGLVQFLQAYVFTLLTASYIGGALEDAH